MTGCNPGSRTGRPKQALPHIKTVQPAHTENSTSCASVTDLCTGPGLQLGRAESSYWGWSKRPLRAQVVGSSSEPAGCQIETGLYSTEGIKLRKLQSRPKEPRQTRQRAGVWKCVHTMAKFRLQGPWFPHSSLQFCELPLDPFSYCEMIYCLSP